LHYQLYDYFFIISYNGSFNNIKNLIIFIFDILNKSHTLKIITSMTNIQYDELEQISLNIINFWFPNHIFDYTSAYDFWFDHSPDKYIIENYKNIVDTINLYDLTDIKNINHKLALIIISDQFTRNIYRNDEYNRTKNDILALQLANNMIDSNEDITLNLNQRFFILLPLRHQKKSHLLDRVISRIQLYFSEFKEYFDIPSSLIKFLSHTLRNYTELDDQNILSNQFSKLSSFNNNQMIELASVPKYYNIIDSNVFINATDNLMKSDFNKDILGKNKINNCIYDFINFNFYGNSRDYNDNNKSSINIGISLSGGVDSMVLLYCLVQIKMNNCNLINQIYVIHIEHTNREEGKVEREFLQDFCAILNVPFYYRTIYYMNRNTPYIDRDLYECESRKIRFNLYSHVIEKHNLIGICIGHHLGDITENVFTNIIHGKSFDNLGVMKISDVQENVNIFRPMLNQTKNDIIKYANIYQIPFFKNSTPEWSCRGVIRDQMIPILNKQFGNFEPNIRKLMDTCKEMADLNNKYIIQPYLDKIKIYNDNTALRIDYNEDLILDTIWSKILIKFTHVNGDHMISNRSKKGFLQWLKNKNHTQYNLSKHIFAYRTNNGINKYIYLINHQKIIKRSILIDISQFHNLENLLDGSFDEIEINVPIPKKIIKTLNCTL